MVYNTELLGFWTLSIVRILLPSNSVHSLWFQTRIAITLEPVLFAVRLPEYIHLRSLTSGPLVELGVTHVEVIL
jgi:hypothetical protein